MKAPPDPTFWLIYWPFCCSSRSSTNSRTLPAWPKPPDAAWRLASASESRRLAPSGDYPTAHNRLPAPVKVGAPAPSSRTPKKTHVSNNDPTILAPMCFRRDDGDWLRWWVPPLLTAVDLAAHQRDRLLIDAGRIPGLDRRKVRLARLVAGARAPAMGLQE